MSHVTTVIVTFPSLEEGTPDGDRMRALLTMTDRAHPPGHDGHLGTSGTLRLVPDTAWGGSKAPRAEIAIGAFNYLDIPTFLAWLSSLPWDYPEEVQCFVLDQHDVVFTCHTLDATT